MSFYFVNLTLWKIDCFWPINHFKVIKERRLIPERNHKISLHKNRYDCPNLCMTYLKMKSKVMILMDFMMTRLQKNVKKKWKCQKIMIQVVKSKKVNNGCLIVPILLPHFHSPLHAQIGHFCNKSTTRYSSLLYTDGLGRVRTG